MNTNNNIDCSFSLFDEGREYTGNHRKYAIENARNICYSKETLEKIKLREAFGYYGHGKRILSNKVDIDEVEAINMPDGTSSVVYNIPSNITTKFDIEKDGKVTHTQQILDTDTGKIVSSLNNSKVGGFSWAFHGDTAKDKSVFLRKFSGFDYVLQPNFSHNRGYVLESVENVENLILESVSSVLGTDEKKTQEIVNFWKKNEAYRVLELENMLFESVSNQAELQENNKTLEKNILEAYKSKEEAEEKANNANNNLKIVIESLQDSLPIFIPQDVVHEMFNGDFKRAKAIFESANLIDFSQYPIKQNGENIQSNIVSQSQQKHVEFGSADYGFNIKL